MSKIAKLATAAAMLSSCAGHLREQQSVITYTVEVRGDDALTRSLYKVMKDSGETFKYVPIDETDTVVFIKSNLRSRQSAYGELAAFDVDILRHNQIVGTLSGECPSNRMQRCRRIILHHLRKVVTTTE
jgi:hypothetical protein